MGVLANKTSNYIIEKLNVTINCSGSVLLAEGDDFTCECRNKGGKPPVSITWYKNKKQITESTYWGENTLYLIDVNVKSNGTYTCVAQGSNSPITVYCGILQVINEQCYSEIANIRKCTDFECCVYALLFMKVIWVMIGRGQTDNYISMSFFYRQKTSHCECSK